MNTYPPIALLVLNYNGLELLKRYLSSVVLAASNYPGKARVIVVDNNSSDHSLDYLHDSMPMVKTINRNDNAFLFAYNQTVADLKEDICILLNNDVLVDENFVSPLVESYQNKPDVFGVMPLVDSPVANEVYRNRCSGIWVQGQLQTGKWLNRPEPGPTLFAHGGACLIDKKKFVSLGGFDPIFWPGYFEDEDISYRAWRRGWSIYYEPASKVVHHAGASFGKKYMTRKRDIIRKRNLKIFIIKNIHDNNMFRNFIKWELIRAAVAVLKMRIVDIVGLLQILPILPKVYRSRRKCQKEAIITDTQLLMKLN